jgi:hypothetical protein
MSTDFCPAWESGVVAPCDSCGVVDILQVAERDYMDEPTSYECRCCMTGHCDWLEP